MCIPVIKPRNRFGFAVEWIYAPPPGVKKIRSGETLPASDCIIIKTKKQKHF
jgi:hypothetical protein